MSPHITVQRDSTWMGKIQEPVRKTTRGVAFLHVVLQGHVEVCFNNVYYMLSTFNMVKLPLALGNISIRLNPYWHSHKTMPGSAVAQW